MAKMLRMFFPCEVKAFDDKELTVDHFITTESSDRSGDTVDPDGMVLNGVPSVLKQHGFDHDTGSEPIARCLSLVPARNENGAKGIRARTQYYDGSHLTPPDNTGRRLYEKAKGLFMPYWSIGFIPYDSEPKQGGGRRIKRWECVEYSQVGVPDNAEAKGFVPSDEHRVLDGTVEHRTFSGVDIDARYVYAYVKGFKNYTPGTRIDNYVRKFRPIADADTMMINASEIAIDNCPVDVVYQKQGDAWVRCAFLYDSKHWTKELAEAHAKELGGTFSGPMEAAPVVEPTNEPEVKSLTQRLELDNAYRALRSCMETYIGELLYRAELPSEKEIRAATKELATFIEGRMITLITTMTAMRAEDSQKFLSDIIERKSAVPADPAPGSNGDAPAPAQQPPADTLQSQNGLVPPPDGAAAAASATEEAVVPEENGLDFDVTEGASSAAVPDEEAGLMFTEEESKAFIETVRTASAVAVRREFDKLRGKVTED